MRRATRDGNVEGGVPSPYLEVPVAQHSVPNVEALDF